jgi:hypothetical protein
MPRQEFGAGRMPPRGSGMSPLPVCPSGVWSQGQDTSPGRRGNEPGAYRHTAPAGFVSTSAVTQLAGLLARETPHLQTPERQPPDARRRRTLFAGLVRCWLSAWAPRFRRAAVNASPGPPHLDTSSPNTHPSSQPTPNRMRAVPADQLPDQDRPRTWWGSGSWPPLRWQRSYPPNCARITSLQRAPSRRLSCPPGTWVMGVSFSAACPSPHTVTMPGRFSFRWPSCLARPAGRGWRCRPPGMRHGGREGTPLGWRAYRSAGSERQP